jgi:hypothetical protein
MRQLQTLSAILARAGEIPACKIGRSRMFMPELLAEYLRARSTTHVRPALPTGGSASASLAERLAARRAQRLASGAKSAPT